MADKKHIFFEFKAKHTSAAVCEMFRGFSGYIQADAHAIYDALFRGDAGRDAARRGWRATMAIVRVARYNPRMPADDPLTIYVAAALFSGRETGFNVRLSSALEARGYRTILPQRDGFEFGELGRQLAQFMPSEAVHEMVQTIIYVLDVGHFIPRSHVVLASLDEPLDDGVLVEISDARHRGIPVVGFRTDVRTPYGGPSDALGGIHFFPAFQCDVFFRQRMASRTAEEAESEWRALLDTVQRALRIAVPPGGDRRIPKAAAVDALAGQLFGGLADLHSDSSLNTIAMRCRDLQPELAGLRPRVLT